MVSPSFQYWKTGGAGYFFRLQVLLPLNRILSVYEGFNST